jgi:hypothetical protein
MSLDDISTLKASVAVKVVLIEEAARRFVFMKRAMSYVILSGPFDKMVGKSKILRYRQGGFQ